MDLVAYQEHIGGLTRAATVLEEEALADDLFALIKSGAMKMKTVPFRLSAPTDDAEVDRKWKVKINHDIEIDNL